MHFRWRRVTSTIGSCPDPPPVGFNMEHTGCPEGGASAVYTGGGKPVQEVKGGLGSTEIQSLLAVEHNDRRFRIVPEAVEQPGLRVDGQPQNLLVQLEGFHEIARPVEYVNDRTEYNP